MKRFSKRRQCILDNLESRTDHPTAEMVYSSVRKEIPNISLGTVYRNLKDLASEYQILSFTQNGKEHFDGNNHPHIHVCCYLCGKIEDHPLDPSLFEPVKVASHRNSLVWKITSSISSSKMLMPKSDNMLLLSAITPYLFIFKSLSSSFEP